MIVYLKIFIRGFLLVALVAANVRHVSQLSYGRAFVTGTLISLVWWGNAKTSALSEARYANWAYGLGAGCGTLFGMWIGR